MEKIGLDPTQIFVEMVQDTLMDFVAYIHIVVSFSICHEFLCLNKPWKMLKDYLAEEEIF